MKLSKFFGALTAAALCVSASAPVMTGISDTVMTASAEEWCFAGTTCDPLHDPSRDVQAEGVGNPLNFGERNTPADASAEEIRAINHKMTVQEVKYALYKEIDEHWDLISTRLGQPEREKMYALFLGLGSRESTLGEGKIGSDHETAYEDGWGVNSAHAYGTLQTAVTAFADCDPKFMPEDNVPEMFQYSFTPQNFYDCIISNHMGIRKILHFAEICMNEQGMTDYQVVRNSLKGFNTGWCNMAEDDGAYATYADEICAMAQFYYNEGHLYDNVFTWTSANGEAINKYRTPDRWKWWGDTKPSMAPITERPVITGTTTTTTTTTTAPEVTTTTTSVNVPPTPITTTVPGQTPIIICNKLDLKIGESTDISVKNCSSFSIEVAKNPDYDQELLFTGAFETVKNADGSVTVTANHEGAVVFDVNAGGIYKKVIITATPEDAENYDIIRNARVEQVNGKYYKLEGQSMYDSTADTFVLLNTEGFDSSKVLSKAFADGSTVSGIIKHSNSSDYNTILWAALTPSEGELCELKLGDTNCDGNIELADAILIMQSLANPDKYGTAGSTDKHLTDQGKENGDVDKSTQGLTSNDALLIQRYLLKERVSFDC